MAKAARPERIDPHWPLPPEGENSPVSELASDTQGAQSPFGTTTFPQDTSTLEYRHPVTRINR